VGEVLIGYVSPDFLQVFFVRFNLEMKHLFYTLKIGGNLNPFTGRSNWHQNWATHWLGVTFLLILSCIVEIWLLSRFNLGSTAFATPTKSAEVITRRGGEKGGKGLQKPKISLVSPEEGWMTARMLEVKGSCSDTTVDPVRININGLRYYARTQNGQFAKTFPAARGKNNVVVECGNKGGLAVEKRTVEANIPPTALKVVLTSDTDGVYTDLHVYEPDGAHVYWNSTLSPSGGLFFLNSQGGSSDEAGYGPYLYVHPAPKPGVYKIVANYWPGGSRQHTLATLDVVLDEGLPTEQRKKIRKPLATGGESKELAYIWVRGNKETPEILIPGQDSLERLPKETPKPTPTQHTGSLGGSMDSNEAEDSMSGFLSPFDEANFRRAVASLALQQSQKISPAWDPNQRDCSGLIRFAYREAIRERSPEQRAHLFLPKSLSFPSLTRRVQNLLPAYPRIWLVGTSPPRFSHFADADTLISHNFRLKGFQAEDSKEGDILVFNQLAKMDSPHHLMLIANGINHKKLAVYHNGASGAEGKIRVVSLESLLSGRVPEWLPSSVNPNFVGVFQWNRIKMPSKIIARK
jgi:uncharacterized protein YfaT (DUF1175 family)/uncharacterized protein YfaP (DUF2135 family)